MLSPLIDFLGMLLDHGLLFVTTSWPLLVVVAFSMLALPLPRAFGPLGERLESFAGNRRRAAVAVALLCLLWSASLVAARGSIPHPFIHDDFACLLGAEMFANGHASYPTHPLWQHFEQFHVLQVPSYASKYPIGNELLMAVAIRLTGIALVASWLTAAAAVVAIFYVLLAAMPARWALAGAAAAAIHPVMLNFSLSYRPGALATLGGALLFGATLRLASAPSVHLGAVAGAGLVMLAMTRPYEGVVLAIGCAVALLAHRRARLLAPAGVCAAVVVAGMIPIALHNHAVTGSFTTLPWDEYARQYEVQPPFVWQAPRPAPQFRNPEFQYVFGRTYATKVARVHAPGGLATEIDNKAYFIRWMLAGEPEPRIPPILPELLLVPFVMLPRAVRRDRNARMAAIVVTIFLFAPFSIYGNLLDHYLAPVAAAVAALMLLLVRALFETRRGKWIAVAVAVTFLVNAAAVINLHNIPSEHDRLAASAGAGKHLFIVAPDVFDVVWNGPEIDKQRVVWARDLGDNAALLAYYRDRQVWRVEKAGRALRLVRLR
jgi:hypothetical protein